MSIGYHDQRSDAALLAAHAAGDRKAFGELFARHRCGLYRIAMRRSTGTEDAEDAVQDAMLAAHRAAGRFNHHAAVGSWLHRIVLNACTDRWRRNVLHRAGELTERSRILEDITVPVETALVVQRALLRLPVEQRAAVVAVDMHGYSIADAARLLGVAEGTVKSRCARARSRLAVLLAPIGRG